MASSLTVMKSAIYVTTMLKNQRLNVNNLDPMITAANSVLQLMVGPPFIWRQNRSNFSFPITKAGGTDYAISVPTMGFIEKQWLQDTAGNKIALSGQAALDRVSSSKRPTQLAPQYDDNAGNITFRLDAVPDQNYTVYIDAQRKPIILNSPGDTFAPIPDELGYLLNKGMLSEGALLVNDSRFTLWRREWIAGTLATQDGLTAQAKQIFYEQMTNVGATASRAQAAVQAGSGGRQV